MVSMKLVIPWMILLGNALNLLGDAFNQKTGVEALLDYLETCGQVTAAAVKSLINL